MYLGIIILFLNLFNLLSSEANSNKTDADYKDENGKDIRVQEDSLLAGTIDGLLKSFDRNLDGYVTYIEFRTSRNEKKSDTPVHS